MIQSKNPCKLSYSTDDVDVQNRESYVFKKFINAAIYVEKTFKKMTPEYQNYQKQLADSIKIMKTKRCSCYIDADSCPCHPYMASGDRLKCSRSETQVSYQDKNRLRELEEMQKLKVKESFKEKEPLLVPKLTLKKRPPKINQSSVKDIKMKGPLRLQLENLGEGITPKAVPSETKIAIENNKKRQQEMSKELREKLVQLVNEIDHPNPEDEENDTQNFCDDHDDAELYIEDDESVSSSSSTTTLSTCSQITVKRSTKTINSDMQLSQSSLSSLRAVENESVRQWLQKKLEEKKKRQIAEQREEQRKQLERQKILEQERENFKVWLAAKKKQEEKKKAESERQQQIDHLKELEKEKRHLENQIKYQMWLKRKEEAKIGKKNEEELKVIQEKIKRERRVIANEKAFQEWLEQSKNKPKPIPLNKGLDSLRSSVSVTYVNPIPWVPNIDVKPNSQ